MDARNLQFGPWHRRSCGLNKGSGADRKWRPRIHDVSAVTGSRRVSLPAKGVSLRWIRLEDRRMTPVPSGHVLSGTAESRSLPVVVEFKLNSVSADRLAGDAIRAGVTGQQRDLIAGRLRLFASFGFGQSLCPARPVRSGDGPSVASNWWQTRPAGRNRPAQGDEAWTERKRNNASLP